VQTPERKDRFEDIGVHWRVTLQLIFKDDERHGVDRSDVGNKPLRIPQV
jgi:hypothetical protein